MRMYIYNDDVYRREHSGTTLERALSIKLTHKKTTNPIPPYPTQHTEHGAKQRHNGTRSSI